MKSGYLYDASGDPFFNINYIRNIIDDKGKSLKEILDALVNTSVIKRVSSVKYLPVIGNEDNLYIDMEKGGIYLWSNADSVYMKINASDSGAIENNHVHSNIQILGAIKYALTEELKQHYDVAVQDIYIGDEKQPKIGSEIHIPAISGAASSIIYDNLVSNKVLVSTGDGKVYNSEISTDELDNLSGLSKNVEDTLMLLDKNINDESQRAILAEQNLSLSIQSEVSRAEAAEKKNTDSISEEVLRATAKELELQEYINSHASSVAGEIQSLQAVDEELEQKKADLTYLDTELGKRYTKEQTYTKEEVLQQIESLIGTAPEVLDTFKEIADALGNDPNFAATMMTALSGKVDKVTGKQLTSNDYSNEEKAIVSDVNVKKHTHENKTVIDKLTQTMLDNLMSAFSHITDAIKHITAEERSNWTEAFNKRHEHDNKVVLDKITQMLLDNWNTAFSHLSNKNNPHEINKTHIELGNVDNTSDEKKPVSTAQQKALDGKVDKLEGKGLSSNDFTDEEKEKLFNIKENEGSNVQSDWNVINDTNDAFIKNKPDKLSQFTNDLGGYKTFTYSEVEPTTVGVDEIVFVYE